MKNINEISVATQQFFSQSTDKMADLLSKFEGARRKIDILASTEQHIVVVGFINGVPILRAYSLPFVGGSFNPSEAYPSSQFSNKAIVWFGPGKPSIQPTRDATVQSAMEAVKQVLHNIYINQQTKAFEEPWEIVHVAKNGVTWLEGHKNLCEQNRLAWAPK